MTKYLLLRGQIYYHELKQMLPSVGQLLAFLLSILYLAISAAILTALISLSVIADLNTSFEQRIIYQWSYFLLLYFLIRIQKSAILGLKHRYYLASLPISPKLKHANTILLTLIAGNLPLLAPIFLLSFIPDWVTFGSQLHFPLFALSVLLIAWLSLKNNTLPWLSLLLTPFVLLFAFKAYTVSAVALNSSIILLLLIEIYYEPLSFLSNVSWKVKYYWQIRWIAIMKVPENILIRIFFCGLLIGLTAYVQYKMGQTANGYIQILFCWVLAILIGSYQFDNEEFYQDYAYYLASLLNQFRVRYCLDILPGMLIALISCLAMYLWLNFSIKMIVLLPLGVLLTMISVSKFHRNFFIPPSLFYAVFMWIE
ncbi:DUF6136 family protein [Cognaticolwellia mytili]|uniref:DUF6136 family protein n=1 Tax=Cognaticolwellia mytili TaxID=1888913 RepID=UPI000A17588A|nr:DUF6136 family protein [Cognaticolwellia mytili]